MEACKRKGRWRADNEFSQNNPDTGRSTEGRSIGYVRDKSAPTGVRIHLSICIIDCAQGPRSAGCFPLTKGKFSVLYIVGSDRKTDHFRKIDQSTPRNSTIAEVVAQAEVSLTTVLCVLNNRPDVAPGEA